MVNAMLQATGHRSLEMLNERAQSSRWIAIAQSPRWIAIAQSPRWITILSDRGDYKLEGYLQESLKMR